jgi:hypothetical protein
MAARTPRALKNDEVLDLGGKRVRWLDTPHVPHNWDAGVIYEETTGTLFSSDLFTQFGPADATTAPTSSARDRHREGRAVHAGDASPNRPSAAARADLALCVGPAFRAMGGRRSGVADATASS